LPEVKDIGLQDRELVRRVRDGDNTAFAELYTKYKQGVYLYCTRFLGAGPAAEDIFQDVFLKCLEYLRKGKDIQNVRSYLLSSAHNRCLNVIRDRKYPKDIDEMSDYLSSGEVSYGETQDLKRALQMLTAENREALILREYQGYSYEEISRLISEPVTTVSKRIYRARKKLREILR